MQFPTEPPEKQDLHFRNGTFMSLEIKLIQPVQIRRRPDRRKRVAYRLHLRAADGL